MRSTCDVSAGYGQAIFKICHSTELNKLVEAMMSVNRYDDRRVYLRWTHRKDDFDIINSSEGKCIQGINSTVLYMYRETHFYAYI